MLCFCHGQCFASTETVHFAADVVKAYKNLLKEKEAHEASVRALTAVRPAETERRGSDAQHGATPAESAKSDEQNTASTDSEVVSEG